MLSPSINPEPQRTNHLVAGPKLLENKSVGAFFDLKDAERQASVAVVGIVAELPDGGQVVPSTCSIRVGSDLLRVEPTDDGNLSVQALVGQHLLVQSEWTDSDGVRFEGILDWQVPSDPNPICVVPIKSAYAKLVGEVSRGGDLLPFFPVFFSDGKTMEHGMTDDQGRYKFGTLGGGPCLVQFGNLLAPEDRKSVELAAGEVKTLDVDLSTGSVVVEFRYPDGSAVGKGFPVILSPASPIDSPIGNEVFLPRTSETDSLGMVKFPGVPVGDILIELGVTREAIDKLVENSASPCLVSISVIEGEGTHTVVLPRLTRLRVEVVGQILNMPIQEIVAPVWVASRNEAGEFRPFSRFSSSVPKPDEKDSENDKYFIPVAPGEVLIRAGSYPFGFAEKRVEIKEGEKNYVRLELGKDFLQGEFVFTLKQYEEVEHLYLLDSHGALVTRVSLKGRLKPVSSGSFGGELTPINRPYAVDGGQIAAKFGVPSAGEYMVIGKAGHDLIRFQQVTVKDSAAARFPLVELES